MADDEIPSEVEKNIEESLGPTKPRGKKKYEATYKMVGSSKIPVSKATGSLWKSRRDAGIKYVDCLVTAWDEAIRYYNNDQMDHREAGGRNTTGNRSGNQFLNDNLTETENIVFANTTTMVPALYSRNPQVEVTTEIEDKKKLAVACERLVNVLLRKKTAPGVNLKPKAKRAVVTALLTNRAYVKVGWTKREDSSEEAYTTLAELSKELQKAKTSRDIEVAEGKISAFEQAVDILQPAGPSIEFRLPTAVVLDHNCKEIDGSDASWMMDYDFLPTSYITAVYGKEVKDSDEFKSIFQPTHTMKLNVTNDENEEAGDFSLFAEDQTYKQAGFADQESYEKAKLTKVWYVWDKITRRVYMFNDADWKWPIWVWDDPLGLDRFFPYHVLTFFESPVGTLTKGEVTYYLDQQDAINEINDEERRWRAWIRRNVFYNKNVINKEDVEAVLKGNDGTARGLDLPLEFDGRGSVWTIPPPSAAFKELFNKEDKYRAIDRISTVQEVLRGEQFKTNTTNDAVQANVSAANMRLDEKSDAIEDWIGDIGWSILQMCLQFMDKETVVELIGPAAGDAWEQMTAEDLRRTFNVTVVGGSTKKPTSQAKKQEALELGQVLGQFVNAAPEVVLRIMLEVMQEAFDEVVIQDDDWDKIKDAIANRAAGQSAPQQGGAPANPAPNGGGRPVAQGQPTQGQPQADPIQQLLSILPEELKIQIVQVLKQRQQPTA